MRSAISKPWRRGSRASVVRMSMSRVPDGIGSFIGGARRRDIDNLCYSPHRATVTLDRSGKSLAARLLRMVVEAFDFAAWRATFPALIPDSSVGRALDC